MTILELQEKVLNLRSELNDIINNGEAEKRELNENETSRMAEIRTEIDNAEAEIKSIEDENRQLNNTNNKEKETMKEVRLFDLIKEVVNGNVSDEHRSFINGNSINYRAAIQADTQGHGAENVPVDKQPLEVAIRNASVLDKLGVHWISDAVGDVKLVKYQGSNAQWADSENADAADGASGFTEMTLSPKRVSSYITISRQFLDQSPEAAEAILVADLAKAVAERIDKTIFGAESGTTARPEGLFYASAHTATGTALTAITFDDVLDMEAELEKVNSNDFLFVTDPSVKYALRGTMMASNLSPIWANGEIDGRKAVVSNNVNTKSLLCLNPRDFACASWGNGLNLIIDPYSLAGKNQIKITVNYLFDGKMKGDGVYGKIFS